MSAEFLLEIGTEELPSSFVTQGLRSLGTSAKELIQQARLGSDGLEITAMGTPRRLALRVRGLSATQPDRQEIVVGPPWNAAFDQIGEPQKAATGFAKKHGVEVGALRKQVTEKGDYVSVEIYEPGRPADEVLRDILPSLCAQITFPKSMRWGSGDIQGSR